MKRTNTASVAFAIAAPKLAGLLLFILFAIAFSAGRSLGVTPNVDGEDWLKWSDETRLAYVSAYLSGHARGFRDGCEAGQRIYSGKKSRGPCIPEPPVYSKYLEDYAGKITEFYRSYPADGQVQVFRLLDGMSDKRNLTIQQMHEYYGPSAKRPQ